jgi:hypothetical protein
MLRNLIGKKQKRGRERERNYCISCLCHNSYFSIHLHLKKTPSPKLLDLIITTTFAGRWDKYSSSYLTSK